MSRGGQGTRASKLLTLSQNPAEPVRAFDQDLLSLKLPLFLE